MSGHRELDPENSEIQPLDSLARASIPNPCDLRHMHTRHRNNRQHHAQPTGVPFQITRPSQILTHHDSQRPQVSDGTCLIEKPQATSQVCK